ncbi:2Fe-2S iron-sulfur cluster-binding protein [Nocardia aurea]|uniref:2Fe-2S iron-sulfur cluster-binding protein n=1 Tax=Nocardia aurea TaxID=2144174 RepID=UPI000D68EC83|nr:2Fe-2S iron-sulfur cluster-binding protein [Nocardia aurea]
MAQVVFVAPDGTRHEVDATKDSSAMNAALDNLVPGILGECGGELSCATCHVFVQGEWDSVLPVISPEEDALLEATATERAKNSRLACQIVCRADIDGIVLQLPADQ